MQQLVRSIEKEFPELKWEQLEPDDITRMLFHLTGTVYTFAVASDARWGEGGEIKNMIGKNHEGFFQLMPHTLDDGFFDWYCEKREEYQFFETKENAALHFIYYWMKWDKLGRPKPF